MSIARRAARDGPSASLHAEESGQPGAPSVVLLHGIGASGWMWWRQVPALADFHCLNVDLPGHGRSSDVRWESLSHTADQVAALVRARATRGRAHVVGLSLGGHVALALLENHADVLDRVVISGVTAEPWPRRYLLRPQLRLTSAFMRSRGLVDAQARSLGLPPNAQAAFTKNLLAMSPVTYRRITTEVARSRVPSALRSARTPTLVVAGGDESTVIRQAVVAIPDLMPAAQGRVAPGLGHAWNVEAPDLFTATIRAWIAGAPLPAALEPPAGRERARASRGNGGGIRA